MPKELSVMVGSYQWVQSGQNDYYNPDDPSDVVDDGVIGPSICYTCELPILGASWYCCENGEEIHPHCEFPKWDD